VNYDYGPLRFSLTRGLFLTVLFPALLVLTMAVANLMAAGAGSFGSELRSATAELISLYRQYPPLALGLHALLFIRGMSYRRRYVHWGSSLTVLILALGLTWWGASLLGLQPATTLSDLFPATSTPAGTPGPHSAPEHDAGSDAPGAPANPLILHPSKPNLLDQVNSRIAETARFEPMADGTLMAPGHIGASPVLYLLNMDSAISAAAAALASQLSQPCEPRTSTVDGQTVSGCVAWVDDAFVGPVPLPRIQVFFTSTILGNHLILGADVARRMSIAKDKSGVLTIQRRRAS